MATIKPLTCAAVFVPIDQIKTDEKRFQNRKNAFSEASADSVAQNYDPNKFDPIVVWQDKSGQILVLSGHSRFEGVKRRGEKLIAARFFKGSEAQAIQFSKVDANRAATPESLIEDINAYRLMRDGDETKGLKPAPKAELKKSFKGKVAKLDSYSYLDPAGKFIAALSAEDRSLYPYIETRAAWVGDMRHDYPDLTAIHETDVFNFLYTDKNNLKLNYDDFWSTVEKRIRLGKDRLFPECLDTGCERIKSVDDLLNTAREKQVYKELSEIDEILKAIQDRLKTTDPKKKVWTDAEKDALREIGLQYQKDRERLGKELNREVKDVALFGAAIQPETVIALLQARQMFSELLRRPGTQAKKSVLIEIISHLDPAILKAQTAAIPAPVLPPTNLGCNSCQSPTNTFQIDPTRPLVFTDGTGKVIFRLEQLPEIVPELENEINI